MKRATALGIIRLTAIFVVFAGLIFLSITYIQIQNMENLMEGMMGEGGMFGELERSLMGGGSLFGLSYTTPVAIIIWGVILYALSWPLSYLVSKE